LALFGVCDCSFNLETVTYDAGVTEETLNVLVVVARYLLRVEGMECFPIVFTLVQNCLPSEPCLCALKYEKLEQCSVIMHRDSPLFVVILNHQGIVIEARPVTSPNQRMFQLAPLPMLCMEEEGHT